MPDDVLAKLVKLASEGATLFYTVPRMFQVIMPYIFAQQVLING